MSRSNAAIFQSEFPPRTFDLITCSEVLYYLRDRLALKQIVRQIAQSLKPNGHVLMANPNSVTDDRTVTGFDFSEIGALFIGQAFAEELELNFSRTFALRCTGFSCSGAEGFRAQPASSRRKSARLRAR